MTWKEFVRIETRASTFLGQENGSRNGSWLGNKQNSMCHWQAQAYKPITPGAFSCFLGSYPTTGFYEMGFRPYNKKLTVGLQKKQHKRTLLVF